MGALYGCYSNEGFDTAAESQSILSRLYHKDVCTANACNLLLVKTSWGTTDTETQITRVNDLTFAAVCHLLTEKTELCEKLSLGPETSDEAVLLFAYLRWGTCCGRHIRGRWAFAAYDRVKKELFVARDASTQTPLYYYHSPKAFVFSTSMKALLASALVPKRFNPDAVYSPSGIPIDDDTFYRGVRHLPSATTLKVDRNMDMTKHRYWRLNDIRPVRYASTRDYIDRFLEIYSRAVQDSLLPGRENAVTLSSGLDSNSIVSVAATVLERMRIPRLHTYTFIPGFDGSNSLPKQRCADESLLVKEVYKDRDAIRCHVVRGSRLSIIEAMKMNIDICQTPHSGANIDNRLGLLVQMADHNIKNLLVGQYGNFTISYSGDLPRYLNHLLKQGRMIGYLKALRRCARTSSEATILAILKMIRQQALALVPEQIQRHQRFQRQGPKNFLNPDVLNQNKWAKKNAFYPRSCMRKIPHIKHQRHHARNKSNWTAWGEALGIRVLDPTADLRIIEFCIGIPQELFTLGGRAKFIYKEAMKDLVHPKILHNRKRGLQACDVIGKIRAEQDEIRTALNRIQASPLCRAYIDMEKLTTVWHDILRDESPQLFMRAHMTLLRGIHYGLFLIQFEERST